MAIANACLDISTSQRLGMGGDVVEEHRQLFKGWMRFFISLRSTIDYAIRIVLIIVRFIYSLLIAFRPLAMKNSTILVHMWIELKSPFGTVKRMVWFGKSINR